MHQEVFDGASAGASLRTGTRGDQCNASNLAVGLDHTPRSGWEPDTPEDDSLLRQFLVNWTASIEAHAIPLGGRHLRRDELAAVDLGRPSFGGNVATLLAPLFSAGVNEVAAILDKFYGFSRSDASGTVFLFSPWPTPDLRAHGWTILGYQPLMLRPAGGKSPPLPPGLRIAKVRDEKSLRAFEGALMRGFESSDLEVQVPGAAFDAGILSDDRFQLWLGWEEDRPVSAAATFISGRHQQRHAGRHRAGGATTRLRRRSDLACHIGRSSASSASHSH
jgi:hypothetical protein